MTATESFLGWKRLL